MKIKHRGVGEARLPIEPTAQTRPVFKGELPFYSVPRSEGSLNPQLKRQCQQLALPQYMQVVLTMLLHCRHRSRVNSTSLLRTGERHVKQGSIRISEYLFIYEYYWFERTGRVGVFAQALSQIDLNTQSVVTSISPLLIVSPLQVANHRWLPA
jgi:hypothetical protein